MMKREKNSLLALLLSSLVLGGCSIERGRIDRDQIATLPPLEVPPNLVAPVDTGGENSVPAAGGEASYLSGYGSRVLPLGKRLHVLRDGDMRWLLVDMESEPLWARLREFWKAYGMELKIDSPTIAIMETDWQRGALGGPKGWFGALSNIHDSGKRDKFRIRLEPAGEGRTELFLTHYGIQEVVASHEDGNVKTAWNARPSDLEQANELMNHLIVFLGNDEKSSQAAMASEENVTPPRSRVEGSQIVVSEGFARSWRRLGIALDRLGLVVEDRNRSRGIYYVTKVDQLASAGIERGWLKSAFGADKDSGKKYQFLVKGDDQRSTISVETEGGEMLKPELLQSILQALEKALR